MDWRRMTWSFFRKKKAIRSIIGAVTIWIPFDGSWMILSLIVSWGSPYWSPGFALSLDVVNRLKWSTCTGDYFSSSSNISSWYQGGFYNFKTLSFKHHIDSIPPFSDLKLSSLLLYYQFVSAHVESPQEYIYTLVLRNRHLIGSVHLLHHTDMK